MSVCHVFAYFAFPLPSWWYIYNDEVYVCLSVTFLLILPSPCQADDVYNGEVSVCVSVLPARLSTCSPPAHSPLSQLHYTFDYKPIHFLHIIMYRIVKMMMIDWELSLYIASEPSWVPEARSEAWRHPQKFSLPTIYLGPAGRRPAWA